MTGRSANATINNDPSRHSIQINFFLDGLFGVSIVLLLGVLLQPMRKHMPVELK